MAKETKTFVEKLSIKQSTGELDEGTPIGVPFDRVFDSRENKEGYTLQQFFDNYYAYITGADFIYYGEQEPSNHKIRLWIDTTEYPTIFNVQGAPQEDGWLEVQYSSLQSPDFGAFIRDNVISFHGTLYQQKHQPFFNGVNDLNKWYPAITFKAAPGAVIVDRHNKKIEFTEEEQLIITVIDAEDNKFDWTLYNNIEDANSQQNGTVYTLDFSACVLE